MEEVVTHLSVAELEARFRAASDARSTRHLQAIWLLAKGHRTAEVAATTAFGVRWVEKLRARYNAEGPEALGDLRRHDGRGRTVLTPALLDGLRLRLAEPPPDGGLWTSRKVAAWMAGELGLASVAAQRGWEALRAVGPGAAAGTPGPGDAGGAGGVQRKLAAVAAEEAAKHPGKAVEVFATDEHRVGLKPILRRVWAPRGERPRAPGHHRFEWLYVTAFVQPGSGEVFWYLADGVSKPFFEALLALFAREAGAGRDRIIVLVLDNAGWHTAPGLAVPGGVRLVHLPPYSPELQPAECLWPVLDEPLANKHFATIRDLDRAVRALRHVRGRPRPLQGKGRLPLVAEARQLGLIIRKAYQKGL